MDVDPIQIETPFQIKYGKVLIHNGNLINIHFVDGRGMSISDYGSPSLYSQCLVSVPDLMTAQRTIQISHILPPEDSFAFYESVYVFKYKEISQGFIAKKNPYKS